MSLINKMLNELDKNKKDPAPNMEVLSSIEPMIKKQQGIFRWKLVYGTIFFIIAVGAIWYFSLKIFKTTINPQKILARATTLPKAPQAPTIKLQNIVLEQKDGKTILHFILSAPTSYYIEHASEQQLTITLNNTGLLGNIPISLENSFIIALNTKQNNDSIVSTLNLLPGTKIDELQLITMPQPHLHLVLSNSQLTKSAMSKVATQISPEDEELQRYQEIKRSLVQDKTEKTINKLHLFVGDFPNHFESRALLVSLLIKMGLIPKANAVLMIGLNKYPDYIPFIKLKAYILVKEHNPTAAVALLQKHLGASSNDMEYMALLAALYQQGSHFMQAAEVYNQLTKIEPEKTIWWIGLGVALESAGKNNAAKEAYIRAYNTTDMPLELKIFLDDKIKK